MAFVARQYVLDAVIKPRAGGWFDPTEDEMEWQLSMFKDSAAKRRDAAA